MLCCFQVTENRSTIFTLSFLFTESPIRSFSNEVAILWGHWESGVVYFSVLVLLSIRLCKMFALLMGVFFKWVLEKQIFHFISFSVVIPYTSFTQALECSKFNLHSLLKVINFSDITMFIWLHFNYSVYKKKVFTTGCPFLSNFFMTIFHDQILLFWGICMILLLNQKYLLFISARSNIYFTLVSQYIMWFPWATQNGKTSTAHGRQTTPSLFPVT